MYCRRKTRSMTKLKLGILIAVVSLATVPFALAQAQTTTDSVGTATIWDDSSKVFGTLSPHPHPIRMQVCLLI